MPSIGWTLPIPIKSKKKKKNPLKLPIVWFLVKHKSKSYTAYVLRRSIFETHIMQRGYQFAKPWAPRTCNYKRCWGRSFGNRYVTREKWFESNWMSRSTSEPSVEIVPILVRYHVSFSDALVHTTAAVVASTLDGVPTVRGRPPFTSTSAAVVAVVEKR